MHSSMKAIVSAASSGARSNHGRSGSTRSLLSRSKSASGTGPACGSVFAAEYPALDAALVRRGRLIGKREERLAGEVRAVFEKAQPLGLIDQPRDRIRERAALGIAGRRPPRRVPLDHPAVPKPRERPCDRAISLGSIGLALRPNVRHCDATAPRPAAALERDYASARIERLPRPVAQKLGESPFSACHRVNTPDMVRPPGAPALVPHLNLKRRHSKPGTQCGGDRFGTSASRAAPPSAAR